MRRITVVFGMLLALTLSAFAAPANATPDPATTPTLVEVKDADFSTQAWECPAGDFCVWEDTGGTGRRCSWDIADPDWWSGSILCSWADDTPVESARDNGSDSSFVAVQVFRSANYVNSFACLRHGTLYNITAGGIKLRSHKWVTSFC